MIESKLLDKRRDIKKKKPEFTKQDSHKTKRLSSAWRRPRGIDSKIRLNLKGYKKGVQIGYRSPKSVRGLDRSGLNSVIVHNCGELNALNKENDGIIISSKVGNKNRARIIKKANEDGFKILNFRDASEVIKKIESDFAAQKELKAKRAKKKEKKKETKKDKKEDKLADKVLSEEEKAKEEKKEKDKVLTKKEL